MKLIFFDVATTRLIFQGDTKLNVFASLLFALSQPVHALQRIEPIPGRLCVSSFGFSIQSPPGTG